MVNDYVRWIRAAYLYYIEPGEHTGMSDAEWDALSRRFYAERNSMMLPEHTPIHKEDFTGGSLFWLKRNEYPGIALPAYSLKVKEKKT